MTFFSENISAKITLEAVLGTFKQQTLRQNPANENTTILSCLTFSKGLL